MNYKTLLAGTVAIFLLTFIGYSVIPEKISNTRPSTTLNEAEWETEESEEFTFVETSTDSDTEDKIKVIEKEDSAEKNRVNSEGKLTLAEVATHNSESSCWTTISGNVYDLTSFIKKHPGGKSGILRICGKDGTSAFEGQHGGQSRPEDTLQDYIIGTLQ